jgi:ssDNA-binding Zn-finger/Zn-ribbon topoisomerase 1
VNIKKVLSKNNKPMITGNCPICGTKKYQFEQKHGKGVVNTL